MAALLALLAATPFVAAFAHRGFAPLALAMGAVVACRASVWRAGVPRFLARPDLRDPLPRAALFLLAFALWSSVTAVWSPSPVAWRISLNVLAPVLAAGAVVFEVARRPAAELQPIATVAEIAVLSTVALLLFEALSGGLLRDVLPPEDHSRGGAIDLVALGRGASGMATLLIAGLALMRARGRPILLLAAVFGAAFLAASKLNIFANELALGLGAGVFVMALRFPRDATIGLAMVILLALALAPMAAVLPADEALAAAPGGAPISWLQRLVIWSRAGEGALDCLPLGCGAEYARTLAKEAGLVVVPGVAVPLPAIPIHPHNVFLEVWLELGIPGVFLFGAALWNAGAALLAARLPRLALAAALATAASFFAAALVETSLWQIWRLGPVVLAALTIALTARAAGRRTGESRADGY